LGAAFLAATFLAGGGNSAGASTPVGADLPAFFAAMLAASLAAGPAFIACVVFVAGLSRSAADPLSAALRATFIAATFLAGGVGSAGASTPAGATVAELFAAGPAFFAGVDFLVGLSGSAGGPLPAAVLWEAFFALVGAALLAGAVDCSRWVCGGGFLTGAGFLAAVRLASGWRRLEGRSSPEVEPSTAGGAWNNTAGGFRCSSDAVRAGVGSGGPGGGVNAASLAADLLPVPPPSASMPRSLTVRATVRPH
jgi:hypothetical protein